MTTTHSFLPPSGASAWTQCPLWPTMNARFPDEESSAAQEGTAAHWVMQQALTKYEPDYPIEGSLAPNGVVVTAEMIEGAEQVWEVVNERIQPVECFGKLHIEEVVTIPTIGLDCFGTPDIWAYDRLSRHLEIIDYKYGHRFVDEHWNPQGLLYMAGIIATLNPIPDTVSFTIVQPRCFYKGEPVRTHTYKIAEATPYLSAMREAAVRATQPNPTATTGPHCENCPGRHACPTLQRAAYSAAETSTDQQPVELTPSAAALELKMLESALVRLEARVTGLRGQTEANLKAGKQVPHYKLESGRSKQVWKNPEELITLGQVMGKDLHTKKPITPKQAKLFLDENLISRYSLLIPGALRLVESNDKEATKIFKEK